jgi:hypothetical protein
VAVEAGTLCLAGREGCRRAAMGDDDARWKDVKEDEDGGRDVVFIIMSVTMARYLDYLRLPSCW